MLSPRDFQFLSFVLAILLSTLHPVLEHQYRGWKSKRLTAHQTTLLPMLWEQRNCLLLEGLRNQDGNAASQNVIWYSAKEILFAYATFNTSDLAVWGARSRARTSSRTSCPREAWFVTRLKSLFASKSRISYFIVEARSVRYSWKLVSFCIKEVNKLIYLDEIQYWWSIH